MNYCCGNCVNLRYLGDDRLFPYRCKKEKPGITHGREWFEESIFECRKCEEFVPIGEEKMDLEEE